MVGDAEGLGANGAHAGGADGEEAGIGSEILPLVVRSEAGSTVDVARMNPKGFNKSRERGVLWTVHDETGRLLPYAGNTAFLRIVKRGRWYEATVSSETAVDLANAGMQGEAPSGAAAEPTIDGGSPGVDSGGGGRPSERGPGGAGPRPSAAPGAAVSARPAAPRPGHPGGSGPSSSPSSSPSTSGAGSSPSTSSSPSSDPSTSGADTSSGAGSSPSTSGAGSSSAAILEELAALIRRRKEELPEGSYTSYLFKAGVEKIRKKTGEEAIELVLARERREVVSESADLIYHLLVYLTELGIDLAEVLAELEGRSK